MPILPCTPRATTLKEGLSFQCLVSSMKFVLFPLRPLSLVETPTSLSLKKQIKNPSSRAWKKKS